MFKKLLMAVVFVAIICPAVLWAQEGQPAVTLSAEAQLCTGVQERMPVGMADSFPPSVGQVYLWCKISGATDQNTMIKIIWLYQGKEMTTVELPVKSVSWRTWSAKRILPEWTGDWEAKIADGSGNILKSLTFKIAAAGESTNQ
jgi:hypothetical protein